MDATIGATDHWCGGVLAPESIIQRAAAFGYGAKPASDDIAFGAS